MTLNSTARLHDQRAQYSQTRLEGLRARLADLPELTAFPELSVFGAGSYARLEASEYSDIDMFFLMLGGRSGVKEPRTNSLRVFGKLIEIADDLKFPKFSNDCEYLHLIYTEDMLTHLGSRADDHENYFTARMLLLLESCCLYGEQAYEKTISTIISSYFKDFPDHQKTFQPTFLMNDICRFWKTLLLNYENKRNVPQGADNEEVRRTRQKVRNFKLKFSRLTTCFATIAALGCYSAPMTEEQVMAITRLTPRRRLEVVGERLPAARAAIADVLDRYNWFLEMTGLPTVDLEAQFADKQKRVDMFQKANEYGNSIFALLLLIDGTNSPPRLLRTLVI